MVGNETISYSFFLEGTTPMFITSEFMLAAYRPVVGQRLQLPDDNRVYEVVRVSPTTNPANQSNGYYLVEINSKDAPLTLTGMDVNGL